MIDYKFWYIRRDNEGFITEAGIRLYKDGVRLESPDLPHLDKRFISESSGKQAVLYTPADFGRIKTDDELKLFFKEQKWQA